MTKTIFSNSLSKLFLSGTSIFLGSLFFALLLMLMSSFAETLKENASESIGGDIKVTKNFPFTTQEDIFFTNLLNESSSQQTKTLNLSAMLIFENTEVLTNITVVEEGYPLYGEVVMDKKKYTPLADAEILLDESFREMGIEPDQTVSFGNEEYRVKGFFTSTPDTAGAFSFFGSRAIVSDQGFENSGIEQGKNRISYARLFKISENFEGIKTKILQKFEGIREVRIQSFDDNDGTTGQIFSQVEKVFVVLLAAITLLFCTSFFWGVFGYIRSQLRDIGILQSIGILPVQLLEIYALPSSIIFFLLGTIGIGFAYLVFVFGSPWMSSLTGFFITFNPSSLISALLFVSILSLSAFFATAIFLTASSEKILIDQASSVPRALKQKSLFLLGLVSLSFGFLLAILAQSWIFPFIFFGSLILLFLCIGAILKGIFWVLKTIRFNTWFYIRLIIQWITERGIKKFFILSTFFSLFFVITTVSFIQESFLKNLNSLALESAPQAFLLDITPEQKEGVSTILEENGEAELFSTTRARVSAIAGKRITEDSPGDIRRPFTILFSDSLLDTEKVQDGKMWEYGESTNTVSVESNTAKEQNINIGDEIIFSLLGRDIPFTVVSIRTVDQRDLSPWFVFTVPENTLPSLPRTSLGFWWGAETETALMKSNISRSFPNISIIETKSIREQVNEVVQSVQSGIFWMSLFLIFSASIVLISFLSEQIVQRKRHHKTLSKIGMQEKTIRKLLVMELVFTLSFPFLCALVLSTITVWSILTFFLDIAALSFSTLPFAVFLIFLLIILLVFAVQSLKRSG